MKRPKGDELEGGDSLPKKHFDNDGITTSVSTERDLAAKDASGAPKMHKWTSKMKKLKEIDTLESSKHKKRMNQYEELRTKYFSDPSKYKEYKNLKYKGHVYRVGDAVFILNEDDPDNDFICKLLSIYRYDEQDSTLVFIEVQWYYKKSDLAKHFPALMWSISENELFLSYHRDIVLVECINGSCEVVTFKEYDTLPTIPTNTFYCRADYDHINKKLLPPPETWDKMCSCERPVNPDLLYIMCDKCAQWFHVECVNVSKEEAEKIDNFLCFTCRKD